MQMPLWCLLYGHGEIDVRGLREALIEAGIGIS